MLRCPNCKERISRFPIKKQLDKTLAQNFEEKTINWINLFKMDLMSIMWFVVTILLITTYKADTETCMEIITHPLTYCEESNACKIIEERKMENPTPFIDIDDIPDFNSIT